MGAVARRPGPSFRALLFGCGAGAVLGQTAKKQETRSNYKQQAARSKKQEARKQQEEEENEEDEEEEEEEEEAAEEEEERRLWGFGNWKTVQTASFLVGSESDVRH